MTATHSDVLILGGGSGGYACAFRAAQLGLSVRLIEADKIGGTCLHRGCIPTKALLHSAEIADTARTGAEFGVRTTFDGIDIDAVHRYKNGTIDRLHKGLQGLVAHHAVSVVRGHGKYLGDRTIEVDGTRWTGTSVVLATGSYARTVPSIECGERIVTSDQALTLGFVPEKAIVLGGGVIGVEFASVWASFGADVTIVEALPRLVAAEDPWCSKHLERAFRKRGISTRTGVTVAAAKESADGVLVELAGGDTLEADILLVAVGRGPRTGDCGFVEHGIALDRGFVVTDDRLRTPVDGVYAVGDIVAGLQLAHRGFQQGIVVAEEIAGLDPVPVAEELIPRVTYSHPEVASVGLTEDAARERHGDATSVVYDLAGNGKSQILRTSGGIKVVRAGDTGPVVGVHMVGDRVGELIGEAQLTVAWEALPTDVAPFVHAHPTQNEALGEAMLALSGKPLHAHG
ncbi:dihydrolipoyl dehydrogenase [Rhodococcus sp. NCIMB 12038]|uniref:dihydrolipoyl dehydrogenase n=1 Tax=Rhodococcus sp. NCIMB 12038 TaxID=933800 RepID=UPI000B3C7576|nr:dihydrolipoyl dehydrogenase [Rhodococcus sp. NCIMB 12038]OUS96417.1 dihydrolipoyl dehydrogenase [Rhodococcus sp. NCIMB 12038]